MKQLNHLLLMLLCATGCNYSQLKLLAISDQGSPGESLLLKLEDEKLSADDYQVWFGQEKAVVISQRKPGYLEVLIPPNLLGKTEISLKQGDNEIAKTNFEVLPPEAQLAIFEIDESGDISLVKLLPYLGDLGQQGTTQGASFFYKLYDVDDKVVAEGVVNTNMTNGLEILDGHDRGSAFLHRQEDLGKQTFVMKIPNNEALKDIEFLGIDGGMNLQDIKSMDSLKTTGKIRLQPKK